MTEPSPHLFPAARPATDLPEDFLPAPTRLRHDGWTPDKQRLFVETLADTGCVSHAAKAVGKSRQSAYTLRRTAPNSMFAFAWDAAIKLAHARLVDIAMERAIAGEAVPIFHRGEQVGERRTHDNRLLMFLIAHGQRFDTVQRPVDELVQIWPVLLDSIDLIGPPPLSRDDLQRMAANPG